MKRILLWFMFLGQRIQSFNNLYDSFVDSAIDEMSFSKKTISVKELLKIFEDFLAFNCQSKCNVKDNYTLKDQSSQFNFSITINGSHIAKCLKEIKVGKEKRYIENIKKNEEELIVKLKDIFSISLKFKTLRECLLIKNGVLEEYNSLFEDLLDFECLEEELSGLDERKYIISLDDMEKFFESEEIEYSISFLNSQIELKEKNYDRLEKSLSNCYIRFTKGTMHKNDIFGDCEFSINLIGFGINGCKAGHSYLFDVNNLNKSNYEINKLKTKIIKLFSKIKKQNEKIAKLKSILIEGSCKNEKISIILAHLLNIHMKDIEKLFDMIIEYKKMNGYFVSKIMNRQTKKAVI